MFAKRQFAQINASCLLYFILLCRHFCQNRGVHLLKRLSLVLPHLLAIFTKTPAACKRHDVNTDLLISPKIDLSFYRLSKRGVKETDAMGEFVSLLRDRLPLMSS